LVAPIPAREEKRVIDLTQKSLLGKAMARPDLVKKILTKARPEGLWTTWQKMQTRMEKQCSWLPVPTSQCMAVMKDTTPEVRRKHRERLLARSNEERFRMGVSMCQSAREIVWSSLPEKLDPVARRVQFFLRYYGNDSSPDERECIVPHIKSQPAFGPPVDTATDSANE
jgi:hypothetical protein